jgi:hypothetical protein
MQELYNKIKPVGRRIIVLVNPDEKRQHTIDLDAGGSITLDIAIDYDWDARVTGFTQGILLTDYKNLKAGTNVLVHHNSMGDENELVYNATPNKHKIFAVEDQFLYFGIDGDEVICVDGYMLAERIYEPEPISAAGIILISEPVKIPNKLKIISKPDSITDFEVGDIAITYKYSDYEMSHTINGKKRKLIRLKYSDCLAKETI